VPLWRGFLPLQKVKKMLSDAIADNIGQLRDDCESYLKYDQDVWLDIYPADCKERVVVQSALDLLEMVRRNLDSFGGRPDYERQLENWSAAFQQHKHVVRLEKTGKGVA